MVKAIIFDLDDTLFDSTGLVKKARMDSAKAMIDAGLPAKSYDEVYIRLCHIVRNYGSNYPQHFSRLCDEYWIKPKPQIIAAGMVAYHNVKLSQIKLFTDAGKMLAKLKRKRFILGLITVGSPIKQWEKVLRLGIKKYFKVIWPLDEKHTRSKLDTFKIFLQEFELKAEDVYCVGDRIDSEIVDGNKLGMKTVRLMHGKYKTLLPQNRFQIPDRTIKKIGELSGIV